MPAKTEASVVQGKDAFTLPEIIRKAFESKGLVYTESSGVTRSKPFATYELDEKLFVALEKRGIRISPRTDDTITLVDENPQEKPYPGYSSSDYWNFWNVTGRRNDRLRGELKIELSVGVKKLAVQKRGMVLFPLASGTGLSPVDHLPNFRMFKALVESAPEKELPRVAREIAESEDGIIVVGWTELGLGGIRSISNLFAEWSGGKEELRRIAHGGRVFSPDPDIRYKHQSDELFITEPAQPSVFDSWEAQLTEYRRKLVA